MNDDTGVPGAVFALKPEWADLILSGTKTVEIRRGRMKRMIDRMLIYRTGTGLIVGEARVKGMHAAPPETIWRDTHRIPHPEKPVRRVCERRRQAVRIPSGKPHPLREAEDFVRHRTETRAPIMVLPARNGAGRAGTCNGRTELIYDITPITFNQLDLLSAGHPQGGFQQTGTWLILPNRTWTPRI